MLLESDEDKFEECMKQEENLKRISEKVEKTIYDFVCPDHKNNRKNSKEY